MNDRLFQQSCGKGILKTVWKNGENAEHQLFLVFVQCFLPLQSSTLNFEPYNLFVHKYFQIVQPKGRPFDLASKHLTLNGTIPSFYYFQENTRLKTLLENERKCW